MIFEPKRFRGLAETGRGGRGRGEGAPTPDAISGEKNQEEREREGIKKSWNDGRIAEHNAR